MTEPRLSRRGAIALGGALAVSGCSAVGRGINRMVDPHQLNADAPVEEYRGSWPIRGADITRSGATDEMPLSPDSNVRRVTPVSEHRPAQPVLHPELVLTGVNEASIDDNPWSGTVAIPRPRTDAAESYAWRQQGDGATVTAVRGEVVYESRDGAISALDADDGSVYWRNERGSSVALPYGETVFTAGEKAVVALDAVTGERLWANDLDLPRNMPVAIAENADALLLSYGNGGEGELYCLDMADGSVRWRYTDVGESYAMAVTDGDRVYTVGTNGTLHAVDLDSGEGLWTYSFERESYERPAVADGTVYAVGTNDRELVALDAAEGSLRWRVPLAREVTPSPTVVGDQVLLQAEIEDSDDYVHVIDREWGELQFGFELPRADPGGSLVQPVVDEEAAYVLAGAPETDHKVLYEIS